MESKDKIIIIKKQI